MSDDLDAWLAPLPEHRREAVKAWLTAEIDCAICNQPLQRADARTDTPDGKAHVRCTQPLAASR
ncbi:MAG: hypothetical protein M0P31_17670 [Solirubrobacteraceae bacterium]|nr:hypothetical protein [Solirubrobacteraceae bacterium]